MLKNTKKIIDQDIKRFLVPIFFAVCLVVIIIFIFLNFGYIRLFFKDLVDILMPIILGLVMAYVMSPLFNLITDHYKNKGRREVDKKHKGLVDIYTKSFGKIIATLVCVLVILAVVAGITALVIPQLFSSITTFAKDMSSFDIKLMQFKSQVMNIPIIGNVLGDLIGNTGTSVAGIINDKVLPNFNNIAHTLYTGAYSTFKVVLNFVVGIIVMIYVLNLKGKLMCCFKKFFYAVLSNKCADKLLEELRFADGIFSNYLVGMILDSIIMGCMCYLGCVILKMPYAPLVSVIVGMTNVVPFFGPFIGGIPSFILIALANPFKGIIFAVMILTMQQIDGNVIAPKILGGKTGLESFYVLFSILLLGGLFGFVGMVIAVPFWAVLSRLFWEVMDEKLKAKKLPTDPRVYKNK